MMSSLLSIFDPCSSTFISNWMFLMALFISPLLIPYWLVPSTLQIIFFSLMKILSVEFKTISKNELVFFSLFIFILLINFLGLLPFGFSLSSHFIFNFSMGMSLWLATMFWGFVKNFNHNIAHLTPLGCPSILIPFMVLVETISSLIRPITISLRLMSNMLAGHMILCLLSKAVFSLPLVVKPIFFLLESGFFIFEIGVALIQTYVYSSLMFLYWKETEFN